MKELSIKSKAILKRATIHRDRCLAIELHLGEPAAKSFHFRHTSDPGSEEAKAEYERLISLVEN